MEVKANGKTFDLAKLDFDGICQWLKTDDPVTTPQQDYFGCLRIAERMAERLENVARGSERSSIFALIGEFGSGKSTIFKMVEHYLNIAKVLDRQILIVPVSLWPYQSVEGAIQGILSAI